MTDSPSPGVRIRHRWVAPAVAFVAALTITLAATGDTPSDGLGLDDVVVHVDDSAAAIVEGHKVTYRVTVSNHTDRRLDGLELAMTTPPVLAVADDGPGWSASPTETRWKVDLASGAWADVELSGVIGELSPQESEFVVTACAYGAGVKATCGSDVNGITPVAVQEESGPGWLAIVVTMGQLLLTAPIVVLVVAAAWRRRKSRETP